MENCPDCLPGCLPFDRVCFDKPGCDDSRLPQRPSTTALPGGRIKCQSRSEGVAVRRPEESPGDGQIAGGVANADLPEVDCRCEPASANEQIPSRDITVNPYWRFAPARGKRSVPDGECRGAVDLPAEGGYRLAELLVVNLERSASVKVLLSWLWTAASRYFAKGVEEEREVFRELREVGWWRIRGSKGGPSPATP